ncbi:MAG: glycosyltransferase [Oscillatoriaceae cyanobacterium Prado104]|jgi:glycosyltransferase involved in cell wall biosynthesis|nr:glycosyltransferase [Oscillatoriaceae cyanobacterium Prado104]
MNLAYLVNQYPKVSHSFVRREILAVETCGMKVARFSIRSCESELVDKGDKQEQELTKVILGAGLKGLVSGLLRVAATRPMRFLEALQLTFKVGWHSERGILLHLAYLAEACILLNWFAESGTQHVHAHFGTNSTTVAMLCRVLGGPTYSFTVHGPEEFDKATILSLNEKIKRSTFVAAVSSFGKSQLFRWCDRAFWSKINVIHCGVDADFLDRPQVPIPAAPRLVCVGRLSEQKGHLLLLEAAHLLADSGLDFKLVFVGDGPLRSEIEQQISQFNLQKHIEITGWASGGEVQQQLLASRAMVLPSFAEGLPVVIMEALALNRPAISTYVAGIPELVEPGVCGWLVPPGSAELLADAMRAALEAPLEKLEAMGKAGAQRVAREHNAALEAQKLVALFEKSLQQLS